MPAKKVPKGNKYDAPFATLDRATARKIADQSTPKKKKAAK